MNNEFMSNAYLLVSDHVKPNTGKDVSDELQALIDANPNRTLFFPDGEYLLSKPICTSANPIHSVSFKLATYAVLKAMPTWTEKEALVRLGAREEFNDINTPGSNYYFEGGIIDGSGIANGISIDSGRETAIHHVSIKNTEVGIHIKWGANNRSSDADIHNVNIVGNNSKTSIGVWTVGHDNTIQNMRIASVHTGLLLESGGNILRDIHPLYIYEGELAEVENFLTSVAFDDRWNDNYYDVCYSDQFCTAFSMQSSSRNIYDKSYIMWWSPIGNREIAYKVNGQFNSIITGARVNFRPDTNNNSLILISEEGGSGKMENTMVNDPALITDKGYEKFVADKLISPNA